MVRADIGYEEWRARVLKRDKYTCQMPYCESTRSVVAHHIKLYAKHPTVRVNEDNGITLCNKCHKKTFGKEKRYAALFLKIVAQNAN